MRQLLKDLSALLEEQVEILTKMLELSKEERQIIVKGESSKLEAVVREQIKELSKVNEIERRRTELHNDLALAFGLEPKDVTISAIAERSSVEERKVLEDVKTRLLSLLDQQTAINNENKELIKAHQEYTEAMTELMSQPTDPLNNLYGVDGKTADERLKNTGFFDSQV